MSLSLLLLWALGKWLRCSQLPGKHFADWTLHPALDLCSYSADLWNAAMRFISLDLCFYFFSIFTRLLMYAFYSVHIFMFIYCYLYCFLFVCLFCAWVCTTAVLFLVSHSGLWKPVCSCCISLNDLAPPSSSWNPAYCFFLISPGRQLWALGSGRSLYYEWDRGGPPLPGPQERRGSQLTHSSILLMALLVLMTNSLNKSYLVCCFW